MLNLDLVMQAHAPVTLPIPALLSAPIADQVEKVRTIWASNNGNDPDTNSGDEISRRHAAAVAKAVQMPASTLPDIAAKFCLALHELAPGVVDDGSLAFEPSEMPTKNSAPLLASALNDLLALIPASSGGDAPLHQRTTWDQAVHAVEQAQRLEDQYDRDVWSPAYEANTAGGPPIPEDVETMIQRMQDVRLSAETLLVHLPAASADQLLAKFVLAFDRERDAVHWIAPILADAKRLLGRATS